MLRQRHTGIIARCHAHRFKHILHRHLLALFQVHLTAAHGRGIGADGDDVVVVQLACVDGLHGQKHGHDLGDAGRLQLLMLILCVENFSRFLFH